MEKQQKRICILRQEKVSEGGQLETWAKSRGHSYTYYEVYDGGEFPNPEQYDILFILGGPQSITEIEQYPYLIKEAEYIRRIQNENKHKIIGVCLGHQLLGYLNGFAITKSPCTEIGYLPIQFTDTHDPYFSNILENTDRTVLTCQWHEDMVSFTPKDSMALLAQSVGCPTQIVRYNDKTYGFQCHFEFTESIVSQHVESSRFYLQSLSKEEQRFVQNPEELLAANFKPMHNFLDRFLDKFIDNIVD